MAEVPTDSPARIEVATQHDTVLLRQLTLADAQTYFDLIDSDRPHYSQFDDVTAQKYQTVADVEESIRNPKPNKYRFGIWDGDVMVGSNNLTIGEDGCAEIGYWVGSQYTGSKYASRALAPLMEFAFTTLGVREVFTRIVEGNIASRKTAEHAGLNYQGIEDGHWIHIMKKEDYGG